MVLWFRQLPPPLLFNLRSPYQVVKFANALPWLNTHKFVSVRYGKNPSDQLGH